MKPGSADPGTRAATRQDARRAFWDGRLSDAEAIYLQLLEIDSDDPDLFGELGNLYLAQGKDREAADAYYEAGVWLLQRGDRTRAGEIADLLSLRGDPRGEWLRR